MLEFLKKLCHSGEAASTTTLEEVREQDREARELTEKQIDKALKDTMDASDPVAKY